jgi:hypothetical protein
MMMMELKILMIIALEKVIRNSLIVMGMAWETFVIIVVTLSIQISTISMEIVGAMFATLMATGMVFGTLSITAEE